MGERGQYHRTANPTGAAFFDFEGEGLRVRYVAASNMGVFNLIVDGVVIDTIDAYSPDLTFPGTRTYFVGSGSHRLELRGTGRKNPDSDAYTLALDAVQVYRGDANTLIIPPPAVTETPTPTPQPARSVELVQAPPTPEATPTDLPPSEITVSVVIGYDENANNAVDPAEGVSGIPVRVVAVGTNRVVSSGLTDESGYARLSVVTDVPVRVVVPYFGEVWNVPFGRGDGEHAFELLLDAELLGAELSFSANAGSDAPFSQATDLYVNNVAVGGAVVPQTNMITTEVPVNALLPNESQVINMRSVPPNGAHYGVVRDISLTVQHGEYERQQCSPTGGTQPVQLGGAAPLCFPAGQVGGVCYGAIGDFENDEQPDREVDKVDVFTLPETLIWNEPDQGYTNWPSLPAEAQGEFVDRLYNDEVLFIQFDARTIIETNGHLTEWYRISEIIPVHDLQQGREVIVGYTGNWIYIDPIFPPKDSITDPPPNEPIAFKPLGTNGRLFCASRLPLIFPGDYQPPPFPTTNISIMAFKQSSICEFIKFARVNNQNTVNILGVLVEISRNIFGTRLTSNTFQYSQWVNVT